MPSFAWIISMCFVIMLAQLGFVDDSVASSPVSCVTTQPVRNSSSEHIKTTKKLCSHCWTGLSQSHVAAFHCANPFLCEQFHTISEFQKSLSEKLNFKLAHVCIQFNVQWQFPAHCHLSHVISFCVWPPLPKIP